MRSFAWRSGITLTSLRQKLRAIARHSGRSRACSCPATLASIAPHLSPIPTGETGPTGALYDVVPPAFFLYFLSIPIVLLGLLGLPAWGGIGAVQALRRGSAVSQRHRVL